MTPRLVLVTVGSPEESEKIAHVLLEHQLAACVQILPGVQSHYWWQGKIESSAELLLLIKTNQELWPQVVAIVKQHHSYETPEIVALEPAEIETRYAEWWQSALIPGPERKPASDSRSPRR